MKNVVTQGQEFGRLTVVDALIVVKNGGKYCKMVCVCGNTKLFSISNLLHGKSKSCGCLAKEVTSARAKTHGKSKTVEYATWNRMWSRCTNPIVARYPLYGGRGISVCDRWKSFENFYKDMGPKPSPKHSLGRVDNNGNYEPSNCQWECASDQANNTSQNVFIEWKGQKKTLAQWSKEKEIPYSRIVQRYRSGMDAEKIFDVCAEGLQKKYIDIDGVNLMVTEWMRAAKIPTSSYYQLIKKGMKPKEIIEKYLTNEKKHNTKL